MHITLLHRCTVPAQPHGPSLLYLVYLHKHTFAVHMHTCCTCCAHALNLGVPDLMSDRQAVGILLICCMMPEIVSQLCLTTVPRYNGALSLSIRQVTAT